MNKSELIQRVGAKNLMRGKTSPDDEQPFAFEDEYFSEKSRTGEDFTSSKFKIINDPKKPSRYNARYQKHEINYKMLLTEEFVESDDVVDILVEKIAINMPRGAGSNVYSYGRFQSYYCEKCDNPYQNKDNHKCKKEYINMHNVL
ncbi:hypothetical protein BDFB_000307 [Asbolus verrucosus]|uniref:Uncharacterized protein n=1 Tax=Asbolus verrucosus TaxID=1661398 RepID=A0A482VX82_ASBVE|nr:hypothetical protein BDFB_000307 [Asbolus verrucosus]